MILGNIARTAVAITLVAAAALSASCSAKTPPSDPCKTPQPIVLDGEDFTFGGDGTKLSFILATAQCVLSQRFDTYVLKPTEKMKCEGVTNLTIYGDKMTVGSCRQGLVLTQAGLESHDRRSKALGGKISLVWAAVGEGASRGTFDEAVHQICAGGYIATYAPQFTSEESTIEKQYDEPALYPYLKKGIDLGKERRPITDCTQPINAKPGVQALPASAALRAFFLSGGNVRPHHLCFTLANRGH